MNWKQRSLDKELLDDPTIPFAAIQKNMQELNTINTVLGGHAVTLRGLRAVWPSQLFQKPMHVVEIGCGGGDNLRVLKRWAQKNNQSVQLTGIDINPACIAFAQAQPQNKNIVFICADYRAYSGPADIIFSSLFCHHFTNAELVVQLHWLHQKARVGFFINDLHRHRLAYVAIKALTQLFSKSYLVKNDAPLSVQRGFSRSDWHQLFQKAMLPQPRLRWQWAFRWLVTCTPA